MKALSLSPLLVLLAASTFAQDSSRPRPRVVPAPPTNSTGAGATTKATPARLRAGPAERPVADALTKNVTLKWKGTFQGMVDLDFEMTGVGPRFVSDFAVKKSNPDDPLPAPIFTINAVLSKAAQDYKIDYSVGARVAFPTSTFSRPGGGVSTNIEFRDLMITGTAVVSPGKPLAISKLNGKELTLEITEAQ